MKIPRDLLAPIVALAVLLILDMIFTPGFAQITVREGRLYGSLIDILNRASPTLLVATGMTLVIATGGVDLSVGAVMAISGATAASLILRPENNIFSHVPASTTSSIIGIALLMGLIAGLFNGVLVAWVRIQPIVATLLLMVAGRGLAQLITDGSILTFDHPGLSAVGSGSTAMLPNPFWLAILVLVGVGILLRQTGLGLLLEASGNSPEAGRHVGIQTQGLLYLAYGVCGVCAALAGVLVAADIKAADANSAGLYLELDAILAVSLGGTSLQGGKFSLTGTLVGTWLIQALTTTILALGVQPEVTLVAKALVVIAVVLLQSPTLSRKVRVA